MIADQEFSPVMVSVTPVILSEAKDLLCPGKDEADPSSLRSSG
jgi:hypothetical protein